MLNYRKEGDVAVITMDDGKANAVSHSYIESLSDGLDRAEGEAKAVVLQGRSGVFSAGFDLKASCAAEIGWPDARSTAWRLDSAYSPLGPW